MCAIDDFIKKNGSHVCEEWPCNKPGLHHIPNGSWPYQDADYERFVISTEREDATPKSREQARRDAQNRARFLAYGGKRKKSEARKAAERSALDKGRLKAAEINKARAAKEAEVKIAIVRNAAKGCDSIISTARRLGWSETTARKWLQRAGITFAAKAAA